ncbi:hypothetical protein As57867_000678, partial [Aphanomyces stellatus]
MQAALILSVVAASAAALSAANATTCGAEFSTCGFNVLSCCKDLKCHKFKDGLGQCLPIESKTDFKPKQKDVEDDEQNGATFVSVEGDATYAVYGPVCGGNGAGCPKKGDVAVKDCVKNVRSYVDAAKCVAPEDASCQKLKTGAWGCVWPSRGPQKDAEDSEAAAWQQCGGNNYKGDTSCAAGTKCVVVNEWYSQCQPLPTKDGQVATWQQCGGSTYKGLTVCRDEDVCQKWNDYYSQCIPKTQAAPKKEAEQQSGTVDRFGQCGGKEYKGNTKCGDADKCQSWNE